MHSRLLLDTPLFTTSTNSAGFPVMEVYAQKRARSFPGLLFLLHVVIFYFIFFHKDQVPPEDANLVKGVLAITILPYFFYTYNRLTARTEKRFSVTLKNEKVEIDGGGSFPLKDIKRIEILDENWPAHYVLGARRFFKNGAYRTEKELQTSSTRGMGLAIYYVYDLAWMFSLLDPRSNEVCLVSDNEILSLFSCIKLKDAEDGLKYFASFAGLQLKNRRQNMYATKGSPDAFDISYEIGR